jgi:hypothetical protein
LHDAPPSALPALPSVLTAVEKRLLAQGDGESWVAARTIPRGGEILDNYETYDRSVSWYEQACADYGVESALAAAAAAKEKGSD